jgi:hypothetical protein
MVQLSGPRQHRPFPAERLRGGGSTLSPAEVANECHTEERDEMSALRDYLQGMSGIRSTGEAVAETSYYGRLEALLNAAGDSLAPKVMCVLTTRNRGAGLPDGGLFIKGRAVSQAGSEAVAGARRC